MRSSASRFKIQGPAAALLARFFCSRIPGQGLLTTLQPNSRAISSVRSVLPESTITISSAQRTDSRQSRRFFSSFSVMIVTEQRSRSEEHTSELQSQSNLVCRLLLEKK